MLGRLFYRCFRFLYCVYQILKVSLEATVKPMFLLTIGWRQFLHIKSLVYILHDKKIKLQKSKGKLHYFLNTTKILDGNKWKGNTKCLGVCFSFVCKVMVCTTLTLSNNALVYHYIHHDGSDKQSLKVHRCT